MTRYLTPVFATLLIFAVGSHTRADSTPALRPVGLPNNSGGVDVDLPVTDVQCVVSDGCRIKALGLYKGQQVGINIRFPGIQPNTSAQNHSGRSLIAELSGGVILEPQGTSTQNLLRMLSALYRHPRSRFAPPGELRLAAVMLAGNPADLKTARLEIKVFHGDDERQRDYFELFINTDLPHGFIELAEKDSDYRLPILRSFGAK
jgi:hypothetical protein